MTLEESVCKAIIGYVQLDVIENEKEFRFGTWNNRQLEGQQVSHLVQSFLTKGAHRFSILKAVLLVVLSTDVKMGTYATGYVLDVDGAKELPMLELEDEAKGKGRLVMAGERHCVHAVKEWVMTLCQQHSELVKERQHLQEQDSKGVTSDMQKPIKDPLQQTLDLGGQWTVILYNTGKHLI